MILLALLLQPTTARQLELYNYQRCADIDGYQIVRKHVYLSEVSFREEILTAYFRGAVHSGFKGELYIIASSDLMFLQSIFSLPLSTRGMERMYPFDVPIQTEAPMAYFYWIRGNMFYQFRDKSGSARWIVLEGENVLQRRFGDVEVYYAGQDWSAMFGDTECKDFGRGVTFVSPQIDSIDQEQFQEIAEFYNELFSRDHAFNLFLYPSLSYATMIQKHVLPMFAPPEDEATASYRSWYYWNTGTREIQFYQALGAPPSKVVELPAKVFDGQE